MSWATSPGLRGVLGRREGGALERCHGEQGGGSATGGAPAVLGFGQQKKNEFRLSHMDG
jgi:hypothetical protein